MGARARTSLIPALIVLAALLVPDDFKKIK